MFRLKVHINILSFLFIWGVNGQNNFAQQKALEKQRKILQQEIKKINTLLFNNNVKEKSVVSQVEDLDVKISVRNQIIKVNNQQVNLLTRQININQRDITNLRSELERLKRLFRNDS